MRLGLNCSLSNMRLKMTIEHVRDNVNDSMVRKWRKQENKLRQVKKMKLTFHGNKGGWQNRKTDWNSEL